MGGGERGGRVDTSRAGKGLHAEEMAEGVVDEEGGLGDETETEALLDNLMVFVAKFSCPNEE